MAEIVGRDAELASLQRFVADISNGASALVLEGEAGMGKTTLWSAGVAAAADAGLCALCARPSESETTLSFSGIRDVLDPVLERVLGCLPEAQRRALSRALVLEEDEGPPPDPHAVGVAVLGALRELSATESLVIAVDDAQWLDEASSAALAFAGRRLNDEPVGLLLARRTGLDSPLVAELRRSLPAERGSVLEVGPVDLSALHQIVQHHLGVVLPRPLLAEVHQAAGGNPFYALEIVRMLRRSGVSIEAGHPLPVPETLHELVHGRLLALPDESRDFLLAAAAHAHPTVAITEAASGVESGAGLTPALDGRVVELDRDRIRFTHPLLAAGAYETADPGRRTEIHARLADLLEDPEARAWQLAASIDRPDEAVAAALEAAAQHARTRGAPRPAALLLDRAQQLTPHDRQDQGVRRAVEAAYLHFESGDSRRAEAQLRHVIAPLTPGRQRAQALVVLARIRLYEAPEEAKELFTQVLEEADGDRETLAVAHEGVAACSVWMFERFDEVLDHTEIALVLAAEIGDEALSADALMARLTAETILGRATAAATAERALALQDSATDVRVLDQPLVSLVEHWTWVDSHARARAVLVDLLQRAEDLGDENARPWLLILLGEVERVLGNLETALERARGGREAAEQSGQPLFAGLGVALESLVLAQLGRPERATQAADRALQIGSDRFARMTASAALGHLALSLGASGEAVGHLEPRTSHVRSEGMVEPGATRFVVDQIEALTELGRRDEAVELLDWYEGNARRLERASALANCRRCRGLLAASGGRCRTKRSRCTRRRSALHAQVELPLDRGRTLLALGAAQRRAKRRREARETLEEALSRLRADRRGTLGGACTCRAEADQWPRRHAGSAHALRGAGRRPRRRGEDEPRGRRSPLPLRADGRRSSLARVREARNQAPHGSRSGTRLTSNTGDGGVKHGGFARFSRVRRALASRQVVSRATRSRRRRSDDPQAFSHDRSRSRCPQFRRSRGIRRSPRRRRGGGSAGAANPGWRRRAPAGRRPNQGRIRT